MYCIYMYITLRTKGTAPSKTYQLKPAHLEYTFQPTDYETPSLKIIK